MAIGSKFIQNLVLDRMIILCSTRSVLKKFLGSLLGLESEFGKVTSWLEHMNDSRLLYQFITGIALLSCALLKSLQGNLACKAANLRKRHYGCCVRAVNMIVQLMY